uniref:EGF-like domain-containing protein n=1 Tax=Strongyloides papillosus TaxID=174720 RepID=A0A0N5BVW1_STREA
MKVFSLSYLLFVYHFLILLCGIFVNLNGTLAEKKHEKFSIKIRRGQFIFDETDGQILPNDYEFLLSPDAEDDIPDRIYEDVFPDLPPHDYVLRGKYMGLVETKFTTPKPITTKFPHTKPPIEIPKNFKGQKDRFIWLNSLHDTLFPDDTQTNNNNKNSKKIEHNVPVKIKSGGQERDESKLHIQQVTTDLDIKKRVEEKNNISVSLKSKNLTGAVNELIKNNKKNGIDTLTNDYNDNISFNDALKLAEIEAKRVLEEYKRREEEEKVRKQEDKKVNENIKKLIQSSTSSNLISNKEYSTVNKLYNDSETSISTTSNPNSVANGNNINDILLAKLSDLTITTTMKPLTTKSIITTKISRNDNLSENTINVPVKSGKTSNNDITLSASFTVQSGKIEATTPLTLEKIKSTIRSQDFVVTSTKKPLSNISHCPTLNAYRDGKPHPKTSRFCQTIIPGIPNNNTCKCRYLVGSRDSNNCPSSFLYLCKPSIG